MNSSDLKSHKFIFSKKFGQNFIFDTNLLQAICNDAEVTKLTHVLEIGAGSGTLTKVLAQNAKYVTTFEIDTTLKPILEKSLSEVDNVALLFNDILKVNIPALEAQIKTPYTMVANLPYYITTPIIFKFVEEASNLKQMVIMVQKEVAQRLIAKEGTKNYGTITVMLNAIADIKITRQVNRKMFTPPPNVDSAVIKITFNKYKYNIINLFTFKNLVKSAFAMRRKTLENNLKTIMGLTTEQIQDYFTKLNLSPTIRGEALSVQQFVDLANLIYQSTQKR